MAASPPVRCWVVVGARRCLRQTGAVAVTIHEFLAGLRPTSPDQRDKVDKFDRLIGT
ncbi:hypothetical protein CcI6DRAFT_04612 [Frankia sp. CcI6]|nr:hypothetical protein CcI6DRAFT_04612 [Frankia sp. CcI6]KEZ35416.1 hypothetical protein CEDDRAFT_03255 [Frankia sp. CeD]KFB06242.1 hypothetical protein ALLO2DRAFT_00769 [Frankia sp. Allo2]OAA21729.1 hypothetical protein AAY23_10715 [Frankia casuarinae]